MMNEPRNTEKLIKEIIAKKVSELDLDNFSKNFPNSLLNKKC